jgi:hypothetical protein
MLVRYSALQAIQPYMSIAATQLTQDPFVKQYLNVNSPKETARPQMSGQEE